jgi:hypothetical protein
MFLVSCWRMRWRSLLVLALMVGLTGGFGAAALSGARRSASSPQRFHDAAASRDIFVSENPGDPEDSPLRAVLDGPLVAEHLDVRFVFAFPRAEPGEELVAFAPIAADERRGLDVDRGVLIAGRRPDPTAPDEMALPEAVARRHGLGPGDTLELATSTPDQAAAVYAGRPLGDPEGPRLKMRVVGVVRNGADVASGSGRSGVSIGMLFTPAFLPRYGDRVGVGSISHLVRFADVPDARSRFTDAVRRAYQGRVQPGLDVTQEEQVQDDAISVITVALVALGLVVTIAGGVWIVAAVARQQRLVAGDLDVLRMMGATRGQRVTTAVGGVAPGVVAGVVLAPIVAVALSPLFPVGLARRFDPDAGVHADLLVLSAAALALLVVVGLAATLSAVRLVNGTARGRRGPAPLAGALVAAGGFDGLGGSGGRRGLGGTGALELSGRAGRLLGPAPAAGVRFALSSPRNRSVPVRPALLGAIIGVVGLVAVAVVGTSLDRLVDTPARWGTTWDTAVSLVESPPAGVDPVDREVVVDDRDVDAAAVGLFDEQVTLDGHPALASTFEPVKGDLGPTVVEGRAPRGDDEVAVGRDTLDHLDVPLGAQVEITARSGDARERFRVVGVVLFPTVDFPFPLADGAAFTSAGGDRLSLGDPDRDDAGYRRMLVRWAPGVDHQAALRRLVQTAGAPPGDGEPVADRPVPPPEVNGLRDVELFPAAAAAALVVLGVISTSHALVVTVRRRRAELGVLSALGFTPRQRRLVITTQATTVACVALVVGVPLGLVAGRLVWAAIAESMGVASDVAFPLGLLVVGVPAVLVVLNLIGAVPARAAARLRVAEALRSE